MFQGDLGFLQDKQSIRKGSCSQRGLTLTDRQTANVIQRKKGPSKSVWLSAAKAQMCRLMLCAHTMGQMAVTLGQGVTLVGLLHEGFSCTVTSVSRTALHLCGT